MDRAPGHSGAAAAPDRRRGPQCRRRRDRCHPSYTRGSLPSNRGEGLLQQLVASPILVLGLVAVLVAGGLAFSVFVRWERNDRPEIAVALLMAVLTAQNFFYRFDVLVPVGPFRPGPLRLPEI